MRFAFCLAAAALSASLANAQSYSHEQGVYRQGATYSVSQTKDADSCAAACGQDSACLSWSFQRETGLGPARCELKSSLGRSQPNPLMISGIAPRIASQGQADRLPPQDGLLGGPADTIIRAGTARSTPAPLAPPAPTRKPLRKPDIAVILEQPSPPEPTPIAAPTTTPTPAPTPEPIAAAPAAVALSKPDVQIQIEAPKAPVTPITPIVAPVTPITPAAPEPVPAPASATQGAPSAPYKRLRARVYPEYSVTRDAITPPVEPVTIDNLDLESEDLAGDMAEPVTETTAEARRRARSED